jgi:hypothetical protein
MQNTLLSNVNVNVLIHLLYSDQILFLRQDCRMYSAAKMYIYILPNETVMLR